MYCDHQSFREWSWLGRVSVLYFDWIFRAYPIWFISSWRPSSSPTGSDRGSSILVLAFLSLIEPWIPTGVTFPMPVPRVLAYVLPFPTLFSYGGCISPIFAFIIFILSWFCAERMLPPLFSSLEPIYSLGFVFCLAFVADAPLLCRI